MKKILTISAFALLFSLVVLPVLAKGNLPKGLEDRGPLTKKTFIHYKKAHAKPPWAGGGNGNGGGGTSKCYAHLAKGAMWKSVENYVINPTNSYGLSQNFIKTATTNSADQWDAESLSNVFGTASIDTNVDYDGSFDEVNSLSFGVYPEENVIAVTSVWGYFNGPPRTRELLEWDMLLNTGSDWQWGDADVDASLMDVENIVAHELGHAAGMGHPENTCTQETMYAYSTEGETLKRDLNDGDISGIRELYK